LAADAKRAHRQPLVMVHPALLNRRVIVFHDCNQQVLEHQFQLFDLALSPFRGFSKGRFLEFRNPQTKSLDQLIWTRNVADIFTFSAKKTAIITFKTAGPSGRS
jgi:hypothetical protein